MKVLITAGSPRIFIESLGIHIVHDESTGALDGFKVASSLVASGHDVTVLSSHAESVEDATMLRYADITTLGSTLSYLMQHVEYDVIAHLADIPVWAQSKQLPHAYTCPSTEQRSTIEVDKSVECSFKTCADIERSADVLVRLGVSSIDTIDPIVDVIHTYASKTNATIICRRSLSRPDDRELHEHMNDVHADMRSDSVNMTIIDTHSPVNTPKVRNVKGAFVIGVSGDAMVVDSGRLETMVVSAASKHVAKR